MKIIALEHSLPEAAADRFTSALLKAEAWRAWELHQAGVIRELYFRADRHEAVLMLECSSTEDAQAVLDTLPLVHAGLIGFELIPLVAYPGLARLFAAEGRS